MAGVLRRHGTNSQLSAYWVQITPRVYKVRYEVVQMLATIVNLSLGLVGTVMLDHLSCALLKLVSAVR